MLRGNSFREAGGFVADDLRTGSRLEKRMSGCAIAIFAHQDDIEFIAAGTLLLLKESGWDIHYMCVSSGNLGSVEYSAEETREIRSKEAQRAVELLELPPAA